VLARMKKPGGDTFERFARGFDAASREAGLEQYLVPYFIASHPGSGLEEMIELAVFLKRKGFRPRQVQDFIPAPMDIATCIYHTGIDPETMKPLFVAKKSSERALQRALLQFFLPENYYDVRKALELAGRRDLIGSGADCLIPLHPPREAREARPSSRAPAPQGARREGEAASKRPKGYRWAARRGRRP